MGCAGEVERTECSSDDGAVVAHGAPRGWGDPLHVLLDPGHEPRRESRHDAAAEDDGYVETSQVETPNRSNYKRDDLVGLTFEDLDRSLIVGLCRCDDDGRELA